MENPVTLVGGASVEKKLVKLALSLAPIPLAADGGAENLLASGVSPRAVIGDMDSISSFSLAQIPPNCRFKISEQNTTDFEKCLLNIAAPIFLCVGFLGGRTDHQMAAFSVITRYAHKPCLLLGDRDVIFVVPPFLEIDLPIGTRVSLFPMGQLQILSEGLKWKTNGITFAPEGAIGTSNISTGVVRLTPSMPKMLIIIPSSQLSLAFQTLISSQCWNSI